MDTPIIGEEPLWSVVVDASRDLMLSALHNDFDAANDISNTVYATFGDAGLFAMSCGLVIGAMPPNAVIEIVDVIRMDADGARPIDIEEAPGLVRFITRFVAAVANMDVDVAWAHWLTIPNDDARDDVMAHLAMFAARSMVGDRRDAE